MAYIFVHNKGFTLRYHSNQNITNYFHESGHTAPFSSVNVHPSLQGKNSSHQNVQAVETGGYKNPNTRAIFFRA